ncbi:hypothetical protein AAAV48_08125 [Agathobaculum butyriciproducens]
MQISLILAQQIAELFLILLIGCVLVKAGCSKVRTAACCRS